MLAAGVAVGAVAAAALVIALVAWRQNMRRKLVSHGAGWLVF